MDEIQDVPVDIPVDVSSTISDGASFDGILDGVLGLAGSSGGIGVIIIGIIGFFLFRKFGKKTKLLDKQQKVDVATYKEQKKESLDQVKNIDKQITVIVEEIKEQDKQVEVIKTDIQTTVDEVITNIDNTVKAPDGRTITSSNDRLLAVLERSRKRREQNDK
jgi:hypothetical protein